MQLGYSPKVILMPRPSAILNLRISVFFVVSVCGKICVRILSFMKFGQVVAEIWRYNDIICQLTAKQAYETTFETTCKTSCAVTSRLLTRGHYLVKIVLLPQWNLNTCLRVKFEGVRWNESPRVRSLLVTAQLVLQVASNVVSYACLAVR